MTQNTESRPLRVLKELVIRGSERTNSIRCRHQRKAHVGFAVRLALIQEHDYETNSFRY